MRIIRLVALLATLAVGTLGCEGDLDIVHGLNEHEANEILVVLESRSIPAKKQIEEGRVVTWAIVVSGGQATDALRVLVANKLPKPRSTGLSEVYPAGSGGLIPTKSEEKAKFLMAMQGEIERMLKSFPGIQEARVAVVIPEKDVVRDLETPPPPATASVGIVYNPVNGKPPIAEDRVKKLVAAAVEDLKATNVEVIMQENSPPILLGGAAMANGKGPAVATARPVLGIKVLDGDSRKKAMGLLGLFGVLAVIGVIIGIVGIVRSVALKGKLSKAEAEVAAMRKARQ
jgi:type III secretion protein J